MLSNHFSDAPTVGSDDKVATIDELHARVNYLEQRVNENQSQTSAKVEKRRGKSLWKKFKKFFTAIVVPVLCFLPRFLNAVARLRSTSYA